VGRGMNAGDRLWIWRRSNDLASDLTLLPSTASFVGSLTPQRLQLAGWKRARNLIGDAVIYP